MIDRSRHRRHMVDFLFTLTLFCVFCASSLLVVVIGANVYKRTVTSMDHNFSAGTSLSYVSIKVRQHDQDGAVSVRQFEGHDALVLEQRVASSVYQTWIYYHDGALRELFTERGNPDIDPGSGQVIVALQDFTVTRTGDRLLSVSSIDTFGAASHIYVGLRSGEVAP